MAGNKRKKSQPAKQKAHAAPAETRTKTQRISWLGWIVLIVPALLIVFLYLFGDHPWLQEQSERGAADEAEKQLSFGREKARAGDLRGAGQHYMSALHVKPEYPEACVALGKLYYQVGEKQQAIEWLEKAVAMDPPEVDLIYNNLGMIHAGMGNDSTALVMFHRALDAGMKTGIIYKNIGNLYMSKQQYDQAIAAYSNALEAKPGLWTVYVDLLNQVVATNYVSPSFAPSDIEEPKAWLEHLQAKKTELDAYLYDYILPRLSREDEGRPVQERLIHVLNSLIKQEHLYTEQRFQELDLPDDLQSLAETVQTGEDLHYLNRQLLEQAYLEYITPLISEEGDRRHDIYVAARELLAKDIEQTDFSAYDETSVEEYVSFSEETSRYHDYLGQAYLHAKRYPEAKQQLRKAVTLWPGNATAFHALGVIYLEQDSLRKAQEALSSAVAIAPNREQSRAALRQVESMLDARHDLSR